VKEVESVAHALVRDTATSWEDYRRLAAELGDEVPDGLLIGVAGRTAEGVREIEVWASRDALVRYERDRLRPAERRAPRPLRRPTVRELTVERVRANKEDG
jgi:hypothetical protein